MIFGALLFITRASEYTASNLFISKMAVVALGTANALALRVLPQTQVSEITSTKGKPPARRWHIARYVAYRPDVGTSDRLLLKQSVFVDAAAKEAVVRGLGSGQSMHRQGINPTSAIRGLKSCNVLIYRRGTSKGRHYKGVIWLGSKYSV
jgi:hypothetical protein